MPPPKNTILSTDRTIELAYDLSHPLARGVIAGVVQGLRDHGGWTCRLAADDHEPPTTRPAADAVLSCQVGDGAQQPVLPVVRLTACEGVGGAATTCLTFDRAAVVRLAIDHLAAGGVESFAFAATRPLSEAKAWATDYRSMVDGGSAGHVWLPAEQGDQADRSLVQWLDGLPTLTGIITPTDIDGLRVVEMCRKAGLRVPADVAVIGVGNDDVLCEISETPLSSIDLGLGRLGQEVARILAAMAAHPKKSPASRTIAIPPLRAVDRESTDTFDTGDAVVAAALRIMRRQIADAPSPQQLASMVGLSRASLERRMKTAIGRSIHGEVLRLRIAEASRLLTESDLPIRDVAATAGFGSVQYMSTVVKRQFGLTPAQLRGTADRGRG
jgi:LacI family transcriptional regulator